MTNNPNIGREEAIRQAVKEAAARHYGTFFDDGSEEQTLIYNRGENTQRPQASELRIQHEFEKKLALKRIERDLARFDRMERDFPCIGAKCVENMQESRTLAAPEFTAFPSQFYFRLDYQHQDDKPNTHEDTNPSQSIHF